MLKQGENFIEFKAIKAMMKIPFTIFADFETLNVKLQGCEPNPHQSNTHEKTLHEVSGFTFVTISPYFPTKKQTYRGPDAGKKFLEEIMKEEKRILKLMYESEKTMIFSSTDEEKYNAAKHCHICKDPFEIHQDGLVIPSLKGEKVRDHCHYTGNFRGAAHNACNLQLKKIKDIPVFFHNLSGYDAHIIFQNIHKADSIPEPKVIAKTMEKFVTFSIGNLKFKDSLHFLNSSLDKLVSNLSEKVKNGKSFQDIFTNTWEFFQNKTGSTDIKAFEMLTRKGVYPYSYMDSFTRFEETSLPPRDAFYNNLKQSHISDEDYDFAQDLWRTFKLKNLGDLHDLYMETDVFLLSDVFETFRDCSLENYGLDPAHFTTAPGLSWAACLKYTNVKLEIPTDADMHLFFNKGLCGVY